MKRATLATLARQLHNGLKTHTKLENKINELEIIGVHIGHYQELFQVYHKLCKERARVEVEVEKTRVDVEAILAADPHALEKSYPNDGVALMA
jgi:hypothetical protein